MPNVGERDAHAAPDRRAKRVRRWPDTASIEVREYDLGVSKIEPRTARQGCSYTRAPLTEFTALSISTKTRTCPHCAEPMFLVNLERDGHDHLRAYKCSNCKNTSHFVLSDTPSLWLTPETQSPKIGSNDKNSSRRGDLQWTAQIGAEPKPMNVTVSCFWHRAEPKLRS
jgi:hypothetical protein